jgi:non-ribosomal peptide synthetase component F
MARHQAVSQLHFFAFILDTLFNDPNPTLSNFVSISQDELEEIWGWNTPMPPDMQICHHDIISEQASRLTDKTAIEAWDGKLTYRQIEDYSTNLAQTLRLLDDSSDQIIPVLFEKSRWTAVAVIAVMKAGACRPRSAGRTSTSGHSTNQRDIVHLRKISGKACRTNCSFSYHYTDF